MTAQTELQRLRAESTRCRNEIAKHSNVVATQRKKSADANIAAGKSKSPMTVKNKLAEAERATKTANDAEKKRALSETKLANLDAKIHVAMQKYEKEQRTAQKRAFDELKRSTSSTIAKFSVPNYNVSSTSNSQNLFPAYDIFLSHASEDKDDIARPLMECLEERGISVWFDELKIKLGQSIRQEIESGIANCRFGVVVVSPDFFRKQWTQAELDGLFGKKMNSGENLILPIWHRVSKDEVLSQSPLLAGILALNSSLQTIEEMADAIKDVVQIDPQDLSVQS